MTTREPLEKRIIKSTKLLQVEQQTFGASQLLGEDLTPAPKTSTGSLPNQKRSSVPYLRNLAVFVLLGFPEL